MQTLLLPALLPPVSSILMGMEQPDHSVEENRNSLCVMIVVLSPWVIRNTALQWHCPFKQWWPESLYGNGPRQRTWCAIPWFPVDNNTQDDTNQSKARREALDYIRTHPLQTLTLMPKKLIALLVTGWCFLEHHQHKEQMISTRPVLRRLDQVNTIYEIIIFDLLIASLFFGCWKRLRLGKVMVGRFWGCRDVLFHQHISVYYGAVSLSNNSMVIMYSAALLSSLFANVRMETSWLPMEEIIDGLAKRLYKLGRSVCQAWFSSRNSGWWYDAIEYNIHVKRQKTFRHDF